MKSTIIINSTFIVKKYFVDKTDPLIPLWGFSRHGLEI